MSDSSTYTGGASSDVAVGRVFSHAWTVFTNNFVVFFATTLVVSLPNLLIASATASRAGGANKGDIVGPGTWAVAGSVEPGPKEV